MKNLYQGRVVAKEFGKVRGIFRENKFRLLLIFFKFVLIFYIGAAFVGIKILYPLHFVLGFLIIGYAFYRFIRDLERIFVRLADLRIWQYKKRMYFVIQFIFIAVALFELFVNSELYDFANNKKMINGDIDVAVFMMDRLEVTGRDLIDDPALVKDELTVEDRERVQRKWKHFILEVMSSERMTERHKYFYQIPFFLYREDFSKSFAIAYSLYSKKYELFLRLVGKVSDNDVLRGVLNERLEEFKDDGFYGDMSYHYYKPRTRFKLSAGRFVLNRVSNEKAVERYGSAFGVLRNESMESYSYLLRNFDLMLLNSIEVGQDIVEEQVFNMWFPVQKNTANLMGSINIASRDFKFVEIHQIVDMEEVMEPGDIIIERRNWYVSNIGIPGFWPHAAFYIGSIDEANEYFEDIFPFEGFGSYRDYVAAKARDVYEDYTMNDKDGFDMSVIEAKAEGVVLFPLEVSAHADYVAVLRPRLGKMDKMKAIFRAFSHYGKPYDYDFDFTTKDALVCSELVYDAYYNGNGKEGLSFSLSQVSGRQVHSPTDLVKKFYDEYGTNRQELDFVYFLDGSEENLNAISKGVVEFLETSKRPKFSYDLE